MSQKIKLSLKSWNQTTKQQNKPQKSRKINKIFIIKPTVHQQNIQFQKLQYHTVPSFYPHPITPQIFHKKHKIRYTAAPLLQGITPSTMKVDNSSLKLADQSSSMSQVSDMNPAQSHSKASQKTPQHSTILGIQNQSAKGGLEPKEEEGGQNQYTQKDSNVPKKGIRIKDEFFAPLIFRLFFCQFNTLFKKGKKKSLNINDMLKLPLNMRVNGLVKKFKEISENIKKIKESSEFFFRLTLYKIIRVKILHAILLKMMSNFLSIMYPIVMKNFVKTLKTDKENIAWLVTLIFFAVLIIFLSGLLQQWTSFKVSQCKATTGQVLRGLFYNKLLDSNYVFLQEADSSFIAKMIFFEFDSIIDFVGIFPDLIAAPFSLGFAGFVIATEIDLGWYSSIMLLVFTVSLACLMILHKFVVKKRRAYNLRGSQISTLLAELIPNIKMVKILSLEGVYKEKLEVARRLETRSLKSLHILGSFIDFFFEATPLVAAGSLISLYNVTHKVNLDAGDAYIVLLLVGNLQGPLKGVSQAMDKLQLYYSAWFSFKLFMEKIDSHEIQQYQDPALEVGSIRMKNCTFAVNDSTVKQIYIEIMTEKTIKNKNSIRALNKELKEKSQKIKKLEEKEQEELKAKRQQLQEYKQQAKKVEQLYIDHQNINRAQNLFPAEAPLIQGDDLSSNSSFRDPQSNERDVRSSYEVQDQRESQRQWSFSKQKKNLTDRGKPLDIHSIEERSEEASNLEFSQSLTSKKEDELGDSGFLPLPRKATKLKSQIKAIKNQQSSSVTSQTDKAIKSSKTNNVHPLPISNTRYSNPNDAPQSPKTHDSKDSNQIQLQQIYADQDPQFQSQNSSKRDQSNLIQAPMLSANLKSKAGILNSQRHGLPMTSANTQTVVKNKDNRESQETLSTKPKMGFLSTLKIGNIVQNVKNHFTKSKENKPPRVRISGLKNVLTSVNLKIEKGSTVCLMGKEGSGRSLFMLSLLGETIIRDGKCRINGSISYLNMSQPLILKGTILSNVIMGRKYDEILFNEIIETVKFNLKGFAGKEHSEILEGGQNLSSTEKRKLLLARTLYMKKDIVILDNLFDPMDHEGKMQVFEQVIGKYLSEKTVIYSSSQNILAKEANLILVFKQGQIVQQGTYNELMRDNKGYFLELVMQNNSIIQSFNKPTSEKTAISKFNKLLEGIKIKGKDNQKRRDHGSRQIASLDLQSVMKFHEQNERTKNKKMDLQEILGRFFLNKYMQFKGQISQKEQIKEIQSLAINLKTYLFVRGKCRIIWAFFFFFMSVFLFVFADLTLGFWQENLFGVKDLEFYLYFYGFLALFASVFVIFRDIFYRFTIMKNTNTIYSKVVNQILQSNMNWYDKNPVDRIIYRLSADQNVLDEKLNEAVLHSIESLMYLVGGLLILNYIYYGVMLVITIFIVLYLTFLVKHYLKVTQYFLQFKTKFRSDLAATLFRTLDSIIIFRGSGMKNFFYNDFFKNNDQFQRSATHIGNFSVRWLGIRITMFNCALTFLTFLLPFISITLFSGIYEGKFWQISLSIAWTNKTVKYLQSFVNHLAVTSNEMLSVERLQEFWTNQEIELREGKEEELQVEKEHHPIEVHNLSFKFKDNMILKGISFQIKRGEKIGIIGDSGSGKHILFSLILKLYQRNTLNQDGQKNDSYIKLFGENIENLNSYEVRRKITYLCQYPILFKGKLRQNIDPEGITDDEILFRTLQFLKFIDIFKIMYNAQTVQEIRARMATKNKKENEDDEYGEYEEESDQEEQVEEENQKKGEVEDLEDENKNFFHSRKFSMMKHAGKLKGLFSRKHKDMNRVFNSSIGSSKSNSVKSNKSNSNNLQGNADQSTSSKMADYQDPVIQIVQVKHKKQVAPMSSFTPQSGNNKENITIKGTSEKMKQGQYNDQNQQQENLDDSEIVQFFKEFDQNSSINKSDVQNQQQQNDVKPQQDQEGDSSQQNVIDFSPPKKKRGNQKISKSKRQQQKRPLTQFFAEEPKEGQQQSNKELPDQQGKSDQIKDNKKEIAKKKEKKYKPDESWDMGKSGNSQDNVVMFKPLKRPKNKKNAKKKVQVTPVPMSSKPVNMPVADQDIKQISESIEVNSPKANQSQNAEKNKEELKEKIKERITELQQGMYRLNDLPFDFSNINEDEIQFIIQMLDFNVKQSGKNVQNSIKKLIMISRALIEQPEILLLDEFALQIENEFGKFFFQAIWDNMPDTTILGVINDMYNLFRYDRIIVLHEGSIAEFDTPQNLLRNQDSKLSQRVKNMDIKLIKWLDAQINPKRVLDFNLILQKIQQKMTEANQVSFGNSMMMNRRSPQGHQLRSNMIMQDHKKPLIMEADEDDEDSDENGSFISNCTESDKSGKSGGDISLNEEKEYQIGDEFA